MGREIKFRAWDGSKWLVDSEWSSVCIDMDGRLSRFSYAFETFDSLDDVTLVQYTGLKDKNGVEIYELDLIRYAVDGRTETLDVFFSEGCFKTKISSLNAVHLICEVVGNKYEGMKS